MAFKVNLAKVEEAQQEAEAQQKRFNASSIKFLSFSGSEMTLRFMPPWTDQEPFAGQFWRVVAQHWNVSENISAPILCPKRTPHLGGECPICDFVDALKADKTNPLALETAKDLVAKNSYLFSVVDVNDPVYTARDVAERKKERPDQEVPFKAGDPKIQVYPAPLVVYSAIMSQYKAGNDIVDFKNGHDLIVSRTGRPGKGKQMRYNLTVIVKPSKSNVTDNDELPKLDEAGIVFDTAKLNELLAEGVGGEYEAILNHEKRKKKLKSVNGGKPAAKTAHQDNDVDDDDDAAAEAEEDEEAAADDDDLGRLEALLGDD